MKQVETPLCSGTFGSGSPFLSSILVLGFVTFGLRCCSMEAVKQNMFDASIITDRPGGASLMVLPLNLIAQIVSNVSSPLCMLREDRGEKATNPCLCIGRRYRRPRQVMPDMPSPQLHGAPAALPELDPHLV